MILIINLFFQSLQSFFSLIYLSTCYDSDLFELLVSFDSLIHCFKNSSELLLKSKQLNTKIFPLLPCILKDKVILRTPNCTVKPPFFQAKIDAILLCSRLHAGQFTSHRKSCSVKINSSIAHGIQP